LAAGYGVWYVDPAAADFEARLSLALDDAAWRDKPELTERRERLIADNIPNAQALLDQIECGGSA